MHAQSHMLLISYFILKKEKEKHCLKKIIVDWLERFSISGFLILYDYVAFLSFHQWIAL